jgi:hypothetical protein
MGKRISRGILGAVAALAVAACDGGTGSDGAARVSIRLTDAPGDLQEAWVRIDRIYLQGSGGRTDLLEAPTEWVDLLTLSGGRTAELVNDAVVPAGRYSELRFVVCNAYLVTREGRTYATPGTALPEGVSATGELHVPSGCASGIKVKFPHGEAVELEEGATIVTVDFDVSQSFGRQAGHSGRWVMHPVLHATEVGFSGGIAGVVTTAGDVSLPACGGVEHGVGVFVPHAVANGTTYTSTVEEDGRYRITVPAATFVMEYAPALSFENGDTLRITAAPSVPEVSVAAGATAQVDYTITAASCEAAG